ncbi:MAG TPA: IPT/TIG domain-containing protein [Thermoleophilia bacterium]|nr:IPT/TIG domain-containing protein [Thermoleophilia bacterium]
MRTRSSVHPSGHRGKRFGASLFGLVVLAVALAGLASASVAFAATSAPVVSKLSVASGPTAGGNKVTITGKNFMSGGGSAVKKVLFGTKAATHLHVLSAHKLMVKAPRHAAGAVQVRIVSKSGAMSAKAKASRYTYKLPLPTITALSPTSGPMAGGTSVTITGTHLADASAVTFGGLPGTITADSATQITATSPAYTALVNANTTIFVMVQTAAGTTVPSMFNQYTFTIPTTASGAPAVTGVSPNEGPAAGGTAVTITGTGFTGATAVNFADGVATSVIVVSDTEITCVAPAGAGTIDVTVTTPKGVSGDVTNDWFTFDTP